MPVSLTVSTAAPASSRSRTVMPPSKVNFSAFDTRFSTILAHWSRSTYGLTGSGGQSTVSVRPALPAADSNIAASSVV